MAQELPSWVNEGAGLATCALLGAGTQVAANAAAASVVTGQLHGAVGGVAATAAFAGLAAAMGCTHNPGSPPGSGLLRGAWCGDPGTINYVDLEGRTERYGDVLSMTVIPNSGNIGGVFYNQLKIEFDGRNPDGTPRSLTYLNDHPGKGGFSVRYEGTCSGAGTNPGDQPGPHAYDYTHTNADGCQFKYELDGAYIDSTGYPNLQWKIEGLGAASQRAPGAIQCTGGRITGYNWSIDNSKHFNFNPEFGGPGGPLGPFGKIDPASLAKLIYDLLNNIDNGALYRLVSVCELDTDGEPISKAVEVTIPPAFRSIADQSNVRLDAIVKLLQGLKDFKQPICRQTRQPQSGDLVSVRFISQGNSPGGERPLRKLLRYRDQTLSDQCTHANHWEGFTWNAGAVCVISKNLAWGTPQIWAETADEGKRVLRHAAVVAGVDLDDPTHKWVVSYSLNPRYGQKALMQVDRPDLNSIWVTKRDGPSGLPVFPISQ